MSKQIIYCALALGVVVTASCYRHPASASKYFFTHHLPKEVKAERKAYYQELLHAPAASTDQRAASANEPAPSLFPPKGM